MADALLEAVTPATPSRAGRRDRWSWLLVPILLLAGVATVGAMRRSSLTFDEILLPASGARGYATGDFNLILDHPPLLQYVYGLPIHLSSPGYPSSPTRWGYPLRYWYAREFFFRSGNEPEHLTQLARWPAVLLALMLSITVFAYTRRFGPRTAVAAAALVAFLPDVLAHGGIAYNDVPMALAFFAAAWALDRAIRTPTPPSVLLAALACTVALGVKFSAIALAPVAFVLLLLEAASRPRDREWWKSVGTSSIIFVIVLYLGTVAVYLGDFALGAFRFGMEFNILHAEVGHLGVPAYLLGTLQTRGFWYFFPVALFFKTPIAFHVLAVLSLVGYVLASRRTTAGSARRDWKGILRSPLRMPLVAAGVFLAFLLASHLDIGVRHALPVMPPLCVLIAVGADRFARSVGRAGHVLVGALVVISAALSLSWYPHYLAYTNEYVPRDQGYRVFVDSNIDWGQELLDLRQFMYEQHEPSVYLSYFGTAEPGAYGIIYKRLPSFLTLLPLPGHLPPPRWAAISATNLVGTYVGPDSLAAFRDRKPDLVLGHTLFMYRLAPDARP